MKILLRPRPSSSPLASEVFQMLVVVIALAVGVYFYHWQKNIGYAVISGMAGLFLLAVSLLSHFHPAPVIFINDEGITDGRTAFGLIRWEDIVEVRLEVNSPFLCIRLKDPDAYLARLPKPQRDKLIFHQSLGFKMINLDIKGLDMNVLVVLDAMKRQVAHHSSGT
jgi:hypothetical protein